LVDESRILLILLKFQLEMVIKMWRFLQEKKVAGVNVVGVNVVDG